MNISFPCGNPSYLDSISSYHIALEILDQTKYLQSEDINLVFYSSDGCSLFDKKSKIDS